MSYIIYGADVACGTSAQNCFRKVTLPITKINSLIQEPWYAEDGLTVLGHHFVLNVITTISTNSLAAASADNPTNLYEIRRTMLQPRLPLSIIFYDPGDTGNNPQTSLDFNQSKIVVTAPDAKSGPFPRSWNIIRVNGFASVYANWVVEFHLQDCRKYAGTQPSIVSNRFSQSFTIDGREFFQRRVTTGKLVVSAASGLGKVDDFRGFVIPGKPKGWVRESIDFRPSPDGRELGYTVSDRETAVIPPTDCSSAEGSYSEISNEFGTQTFIETSITLRAPKEVSKQVLFERASQIVLSRINLAGNGNRRDVLQTAVVSENMFSSNELTLRVRALRVPGKDGMDNFRMIDLTNIGKTIPGTESQESMDWQARSNLLKCIYQKFLGPCEDSDDVYATPNADKDPLQPGEANSDDGPSVTFSPPGDPEYTSDPSRISDDQARAMFTDYKVKTSYKTAQCSIVLPVAGTQADIDAEIIDGSPTIVDLALPVQTMVVEWECERIGLPPLVPRAEPTEYASTAQLLDKEQSVDAPQLSASGTEYVFKASGRYEYAVARRPVNENTEGLGMASLPWDTSDISTNRLGAVNFKDGISSLPT